MAGRFDGRVVLVTGGGSGIGQAAARRFADEGAAVAVLDLRPDAAEETAGKIRTDGGRALPVAADVADADQVAAAVSLVAERLGRIDVLYNNAGVGSHGSVTAADEADWDRCFAVNVKGTFLCSRAAVPYLEAGGGGAIVNQGSVAALVGVSNFAAYCAAKGAVVALTRSMAVDLAPHGIRVNVLCPGTVLTQLMEPLIRARGGGDLSAGLAATASRYPLGRLGTPGEIAAAAVFLASDDASFFTGAVITPDGGMTAQ